MNLTLIRKIRRPDGIISELYEGDKLLAHTLEHAYNNSSPPPTMTAKLPSGSYVCKRGPHRLHGMQKDFESFEITGVPGRAGILFHWGNYNEDSEGCVLLGASYAVAGDGRAMVTASRATFAAFMEHTKDLAEFTLTVREQA